MAVDFRKLLDKKAEDVVRPAPLPGGSWKLLVLGYEFAESAQKQTPGVAFKFRPIEAGADVDPNELLDQKGNPIDLAKKELRDSFWLTERAEFRLVDFYKACGLNTEGRILYDLLDEAKGCYVWADVGVKPNQDPEKPGYNEVKGYSKVE